MKKLTGLKPRETQKTSPTPALKSTLPSNNENQDSKKPWSIKDAIAKSNETVATKSPKLEEKKGWPWSKKEEKETKIEQKSENLEVKEEKRSWSPFAKGSRQYWTVLHDAVLY